MQKINFQNLPSTATPINATNLNAIQDNVEDAIDDIITDLSGYLKTTDIIITDYSTTPVSMTTGNTYTGNITFSPPSGYRPVSISVLNTTYADANFVSYNCIVGAQRIYYQIRCGYGGNEPISTTFRVIYMKN